MKCPTCTPGRRCLACILAGRVDHPRACTCGGARRERDRCGACIDDDIVDDTRLDDEHISELQQQEARRARDHRLKRWRGERDHHDHP